MQSRTSNGRYAGLLTYQSCCVCHELTRVTRNRGLSAPCSVSRPVTKAVHASLNSNQRPLAACRLTDCGPGHRDNSYCGHCSAPVVVLTGRRELNRTDRTLKLLSVRNMSTDRTSVSPHGSSARQHAAESFRKRCNQWPRSQKRLVSPHGLVHGGCRSARPTTSAQCGPSGDVTASRFGAAEGNRLRNTRDPDMRDHHSHTEVGAVTNTLSHTTSGMILVNDDRPRIMHAEAERVVA
jgi:hypothetical protein